MGVNTFSSVFPIPQVISISNFRLPSLLVLYFMDFMDLVTAFWGL